jgi:hypothetical protein
MQKSSASDKGTLGAFIFGVFGRQPLRGMRNQL